MKFNEDSRVKIPAILHLSRLGYTYLSLKGLAWDETSNIVPSIFRTSVAAINPAATPADIDNALGQWPPKSKVTPDKLCRVDSDQQTVLIGRVRRIATIQQLGKTDLPNLVVFFRLRCSDVRRLKKFAWLYQYTANDDPDASKTAGGRVVHQNSPRKRLSTG